MNRFVGVKTIPEPFGQQLNFWQRLQYTFPVATGRAVPWHLWQVLVWLRIREDPGFRLGHSSPHKRVTPKQWLQIRWCRLRYLVTGD